MAQRQILIITKGDNMGTLTASSLLALNDGSYERVDANLAFGSAYNNTGNDATTGELLTAASLGLAQIISVVTPSEEAGYGFEVLGLANGPASSCRIKVFQGGSGTTGATSAGTPAGTNSTSAVTGTGTFTGTAPLGDLNIASPAFSGTGQSSSGQVITTTDNQTMTLNQCAGMWFVSATHGPYLIASNTAVSGAQAVLTIVGTPPTTDAGAYQILKALTPVGTVSALSGTAAAQTFTGTAMSTHTHSIGATGGGEVPNGTNLSVSLASVRISASGY